MTLLIYLGSIVGALLVMFGVYSVIRRYAAVYLIVISIGAGVVAGKVIIAKSLGPFYSVLFIAACGVIAGIVAIPALLISDIEDLEEKFTKQFPESADAE